MRAAVVLAFLLGGCTLFDDPPSKACTKNTDCFLAQGETCNLTTKQCEVGADVDAMPAQSDVDETDELASEVAQ